MAAEFPVLVPRATSITTSSGRVIPVDRGSVFLDPTVDAAVVAELRANGQIGAEIFSDHTSGLTTELVTLAPGVPKQIVAARAGISYLAIENTGTGDARLTFGAAPVAGEGLPLNAADVTGRQGGGHIFEGGNAPGEGVWAVSSAGTTLTVVMGTASLIAQPLPPQSNSEAEAQRWATSARRDAESARDLVAQASGQAAQGAASVVQPLAAQLTQALAQASDVLPKTNGTATGLQLANDPTADQHAVRKSWYDARRTSFTTRAEMAAASIPTAVTRVTTLFYDTTRIKASARLEWRVWGTSAPSDGRDFILSADGRYWVIASTHLNPYQFGAWGNFTDDTAALTAWWNTGMAMGAGAATNPAIFMPKMEVPTGNFRGYDLLLTSTNTGVVLRGPGLLDGVRIRAAGQKWKMGGFDMVDTRGTGTAPWTAGATAIEIVSGANNGRITDVNIFNYEFGIVGRYGAARWVIANCNTGACRIPFFGAGMVDSRVIGCDFAGDAYTDANVLIQGSQEVKFTNCRGIGSRFGGLYLRGSPIQGVIEQYYTDCTWTGDIATTSSIVGITDNGSGKARVTLTPMLAVSAVAAQAGAFLGRGNSPVGAFCWADFAGTAGSIDAVMVAGTALIAAPVAFNTSAAYTAQLVADAINARTAIHGYSARSGYARTGGPRACLEVYAPVSLYGTANGRQLSITASNGLTVAFPSFTLVTTSTPHGFTGSEDVHLLTASDNSPGAVEPLWGCPSSTTFLIRAPVADVTAGAFTRVCVAQRLRRGLPSLVISGSPVAAYNGTWDSAAVGPNWMDITPTNGSAGVTWTANAVGGSLTRANWNAVLDAEEQASNVSDTWDTAGNEGLRLVRSAFNVGVSNKRLARQVQVDPRVSSGMRSALLLFGGMKRNRAPNGAGDFVISGADRGFGLMGMANPNSSFAPDGAQGPVMEVPATGVATVDMAAQLNRIAVSSDGLRFTMGGTDFLWGKTAFPIGPHNLGNMDLVNGVALGSVTSGPVSTVSAVGQDTNIGLRLISKGTFAVEVSPGGLRAMAFNYVASAANYFSVYPSAAGSALRIAATGTDANIDINIVPKGAGRVWLGPRTANADAAISGYVEVKDTSGVLRKLAVID